MTWTKGNNPPRSGYYLAVWQIHPGHSPTVSELWFNGSDGRGSWWATRGYTEGFGSRSRPFSTQEIVTVMFWMPMPAAPTEAYVRIAPIADPGRQRKS